MFECLDGIHCSLQSLWRLLIINTVFKSFYRLVKCSHGKYSIYSILNANFKKEMLR